MADQTPNNSTPPPSPGDQPTPSKKPRWGRRILIAAGVVLLLLLLLVALSPTIASMGFVRSIVVGKINDNLNGKVAIEDWSLGWTGGINANGITVVDSSGQKAVELRKLHTDLSLIDAIRGRYDLGKVTVDGLRANIVMYDDGTNNLQKLTKSQPEQPSQAPSAPSAPTPPSASAQPAAGNPLPDISADLVLTDCQATVSGAGVPTPIQAAFAGQLTIPGLNQTLTDSLNATLAIGGQPAGKIDLSGSADVFKNNQFDDKTASATQKLTLQGVELASFAPFLPRTAITSLQGVTDGGIVVDLKNGTAGTLQGQLVTRNVSASGPALSGDTFQTDALSVTIPATLIAMPNGLANRNAFHIRTGGDSVAPIVVSLGKSPSGDDLGHLQAQVDAGFAALSNLASGKAPGSEGKVEVANAFDIAALSRMMPRALKLVEGVQLQSGKQTQQTTITLTPKEGIVHTVTDLSAISGVNTKTNRPIAIRPIHLDASAAAGGAGVTDFRNISLNLTSGFANASFKGQTLADLAGTAQGDLKAAHDELGQVFDFGPLDAAGTFDMKLASSGNLAEEKGKGKVETQLTLQNLKVAGLADGKTIDQKWMNVTATADLVRGQQKFLDAINNLVATIKTGDPANPTIDVVTSANVNLAGTTPTIGFALQKLFIDAAKAQTEFAAFVPGDYRVTSGTVTASAVGTWSGGTLKLDNLTAQPSNLSVNLQGKNGASTPVVNALTMNVDTAGTVATGQQQTINLSKLNVVEQSKRLVLQKVSDGPLVLTTGPSGFSGNGKLQVGADLAFVNSIVQAVSSGGQQVVAQTKAGDVRSGTLDGTLAFDSASGKPTTVAGDFKIANLVVATAAGATQPETITLTLQATAPADFSTLAAQNVSLKSRFANLNVTDSLLKLKDPANPDAPVATFDKVQKANVALDVSDVGAFYTIASAFMPPAAPADQPAGPLTVAGGHAKANLVVARDSGATTVKVSDLSGGDIQLRRGARAYTVQPFSVQLAATAKNAGDQLSQIDVSQLSGKLGIADLSMEQPISIKNPGGEQMAASGTIRLAGKLEQTSDLLAVMQGNPLPYAGSYVLVQKLSTEGGAIGLAGTADLTNFQVLDSQGKPTFAEDKVAVTNDLKINQKAKNVAGNLNVDSKALGVKFTGGVKQFDTARTIDPGTSLVLDYDAAQVWQIVRPMMSPESQQSLADLRVAGKKQATFQLGGSYPADVPFQQAIQQLTATGALPLDSLEMEGLDAKNINPGFNLSGGKLTVNAAPGAQPVAVAPTTQQGAPQKPMVVTAQVNGGTVDLTGAVVDLTTPEPSLSMPADKALAQNIALSGILARYANLGILPIFDEQSQTALANVTVVKCDQLPLGNSLTTPNATGVAQIIVSLTNVKPGGQIMSGLDKVLGSFTNSIQATVQPTTITISQGTARIDNFVLAYGQQQHQGLKFNGTAGLGPNGALNLTANIPSDLIKRFGSDAQRFLPQGVDVPIGGTRQHPELASADKIIASLGKQALTNLATGALTGKGGKDGKGGGLGDILGNVLGGNSQQQQQQQQKQQAAPQQQQQQQDGQSAAPSQAQPADPSPADAIGGLLNSLTRDRNDKNSDTKKKQQKDQPANKKKQ